MPTTDAPQARTVLTQAMRLPSKDSTWAGLSTGVWALQAGMFLWPQNARPEPLAPRASLKAHEACSGPWNVRAGRLQARVPYIRVSSGVIRPPLQGLGLTTCSVEGKILPGCFSVFCFDKFF